MFAKAEHDAWGKKLDDETATSKTLPHFIDNDIMLLQVVLNYNFVEDKLNNYVAYPNEVNE